MPAFLPIVLTASHLVLAANSIPKFDLERTCRPAAEAAEMPGRDSAACQRDERDARSKLEQDWAQYNAAQKGHCAGFAALDRHRVTWSCSPAWKWQSKHRSFRQRRKQRQWAASNSEDFFPGGLP